MNKQNIVCKTCNHACIVPKDTKYECRRRAPDSSGFCLMDPDDSCGEHEFKTIYRLFCMEPGPDGSVCVYTPRHETQRNHHDLPPSIQIEHCFAKLIESDKD